jgi:asparagine synthase (glutamine-hydrolysing)
MCGIAGILSASPRHLGAQGQDLLHALRHRGPDDAGWLTWAPSGVRLGQGRPDDVPSHVFLVHRRLSILDLSEAGWQPMGSPDGSHHVVFNGEIYNYVELRRELEHLGHHFHSGSDTEVLLRLFALCGPGALSRLVGMFAFAVLDTARRTLLLARDFFGIKPLYYTFLTEGLAFASEIKALLRLPGVQRQIHPTRLYEYLRLGRTDHGADTMFVGIHQLPAAHYLEISLDDIGPSEPVAYWQLDEQDTLDLSREEAAEKLRDLFLDNVRLHLRSDVPVGAALSGGIDSSAIVTGMRLLEPEVDLHTFSYIAEDPRVNEERWVDTAGKAAGATLHKVRATPLELAADLDELIRAQDEPFGSTSIYAQYRVFRQAREAGIKVMLDGQGADEMFAGYRMFQSGRLASLIRHGRWLRAASFLGRAAQQPGSGGLRRLVLQTGGLLAPALKPVALGLVGKDLMPTWLNRRWFEERGVVSPLSASLRGRNVLSGQLQQSLTTTSLPMLLRFEDRNSMAHSIESRVPFLTPALAEFVFRLPEEYLLDDDGLSKSILRQALRGIVPDAILDRRDKIGFETPERAWLLALRPWTEDTLSSKALQRVPALVPGQLRRQWGDVLSGRRAFDSQVWRWLNLVRWVELNDVGFDA